MKKKRAMFYTIAHFKIEHDPKTIKNQIKDQTVFKNLFFQTCNNKDVSVLFFVHQLALFSKSSKFIFYVRNVLCFT